jgi:hypothetical protein
VRARDLLAFAWTVGLSVNAVAHTPARCVADSDTPLDFWLGTWDVRLPDGTLAGTDVIEKDGCVVLEHWADVRGSRGESLFFYRPADRSWNQVWTTPSGAVKEKRMLAGPQPPAIRLAGHAFLADGRSIPDRTTLTPLGNGSVRQPIEQSPDRGATWQVAFGAVYSRRAGTQPQPARPGCDTPEHRQFDFWVGEWEVTTPDGKLAGRNSIAHEMNGCVLHERWVGAGGMKGESLNIWHRESRQWHQTWVSDRGDLLRLDGRLENGVMHMTGVSGPPDRPVTNRITWSPAADATVRQHWEVSTDGGKTWKTSFDGRYRRVKE